MTQEELEAAGVPPGEFYAPGWAWDPANTTDWAIGPLTAAISDIGKHEQPKGSNDGPQLAKFRTGGQPWCALAVSEWFREGLLESGGCPWGVLASALKIKDWGTRNGKLVPKKESRPGDVFVIMRTEIHGHVGLVAAIEFNHAYTIEGNAGDAVRGGRRLIDSFTCVVRIRDA